MMVATVNGYYRLFMVTTDGCQSLLQMMLLQNGDECLVDHQLMDY